VDETTSLEIRPGRLISISCCKASADAVEPMERKMIFRLGTFEARVSRGADPQRLTADHGFEVAAAAVRPWNDGCRARCG